MGRMGVRTSTSPVQASRRSGLPLRLRPASTRSRDPLEVRKATLESVLSNAGPGIRYNEHIEGDAEDIFRHACKLRLEGIVSKLRLEGIVSKLRRSVYRSGRSRDWIKMKNPDCDAVRREAEEDWGPRPMRARR